jgi:cell pole-organizing protein PopZ
LPPVAEPVLAQAELEPAAFQEELEPPPPEPPASDILELTESMAAPEPPPPAAGFQTIDAQSDLVFEDRPLEPEPVPPPPMAPRNEPPSEPLISATTTAAVDSAFNTLAHTVLVQNARTLEDLVREMLRPLLKAWLDDNLPRMVERLVRAEIERVSRGRT